MATGLAIGDTVFVPTSLLQKAVLSPSAFYKSQVVDLEAKSAKIDVGGGDTEFVATSKCQRNIGIAVLAIGDFHSEATLIDPLSKSITQFCRLLCSDDYVRFYKIRSVDELRHIWQMNHRIYSHVIVVSHGNGSAMKFAVDGWQGADDLREVLDIEDVTGKCFVNLSCELGKAPYGKGFSRLNACDFFIAPFHTVHGAIASQFAQSFLIFHLIHGYTIKMAFRHARNYVAGSTSFRMWRRGSMITDN